MKQLKVCMMLVVVAVMIGSGIAQDRHNTFYVFSEAEYKRWVKATESVDDEWMKEVAAKGGNGKALLNDAKVLLKKYKD